MKLSSKSCYAIRTLVELATGKGTAAVRAEDLASSQSIPHKFLEQILLILKSGGIVGSRRGVGGGYFLTKKASEIRLDQVLSIMGESLLSPLELRKDVPADEAVLGIMGEIQDSVRRRLSAISLEDLCLKVASLGKNAIDYVI